ncbi:MAG: hypothetical protein WAV52_05880, partial [Luteococcus japonicus]
MLDKIDFDVAPISKDEYKPEHDALVKRLTVLQQEAHNKGIGVVVLFEGWDGAGKGGRISDLLYNLDARATSVHVTEGLDSQSARAFFEQRMGAHDYYPMMQQFWKALGPRGNMTFFDRGWYEAALRRLLITQPHLSTDDLRVDDTPDREVEQYLDALGTFERQLVNDGYLVLKFFLHIRKKTQRHRLKRLAGDPATAWR